MSAILGVLGTGSSVGKTALVAALGRQLADAGRRVVPFKPQNMATNAAPARRLDGSWGEIGTAQYLQAVACRQPPLCLMNPILLKPVDGGRCETVVDGLVVATEDWASYGGRATYLRQLVLRRLDELQQQTAAEVVLVEGAGSCVEMNLLAHDVGNLPLLRRLGAPWILVADIDRGGIFAQVVGCMHLLPEDWRQCRAVVVNRLRGEPRYFADGAIDLARRVGKPVHVITELDELHLPEEDHAGARWQSARPATEDPRRALLVVVQLPHLAMTGDLAPVAADPGWRLRFCQTPPRDTPAAVILPGSKLSGSDLAWLRHGPWAAWLTAYAAAGGRILGLCGGYQLLGEAFVDTDGRDGPAGTQPGLGLLPIRTVASNEKLIAPRQGRLLAGPPVSGYEIRWGRSSRHGGMPLLLHEAGEDGCQRGSVAGTYLHGILASTAARQALLGHGEDSDEDPIDRLAAHCAAAGLRAVDLLAQPGETG